MPYLYLAIAILAEVIGTSALKATHGFTRLWPSLVVVAGYGVAFYFLSLSLRSIPVGVAYAIWSGAGVALITLIGWLVFKQKLDAPALAGILLIVAGVVVQRARLKSDPPPADAPPPSEPMFAVEPRPHEAFADLAATAGARIEEELHARRLLRRRWTAYLFLALAIVAGVTGTSALSAYLVCFVALTRALQVIPVSIAYAVWSGLGIALIALIGWVVFDQALGAGELAGIGLILVGTVVIQLFSRSTTH